MPTRPRSFSDEWDDAMGDYAEQDRYAAESERISDAIAFHDHELLKDEPELDEPEDDDSLEVDRYILRYCDSCGEEFKNCKCTGCEDGYQ